jgi:hypothetical protein
MVHNFFFFLFVAFSQIQMREHVLVRQMRSLHVKFDASIGEGGVWWSGVFSSHLYFAFLLALLEKH